MNEPTEAIKVLNIDHLGIIAGIIDEMELVEEVNKKLATSGGSIRNQVKKLTNRPTMRWVFQLFQSVHLLIINGRKQMSNLTEERRKILNHLGSFCSQYYLMI